MSCSSPVQSTLDSDLLETARRALLEGRAQVREGARGPSVDRLLAWMDAGYYGRCSVCSRPIEASRLEQDPTTSVCRDCSNHRAAPGALI